MDVGTRDVEESDLCLQSACGAGEIRYWRMDGTRIESVALVKDAWWSSWSLPIGWPVQGILTPRILTPLILTHSILTHRILTTHIRLSL